MNGAMFQVRRWWLAAGLVAVVLLTSPSSVAADQLDVEYQIKAAFLYKFGGYVEWPEGSSSDQDFTIVVMGADLLVRYLSEIVEGRSVAGRPVNIRTLRSIDDLEDAQVLFVGKSAKDDAGPILERVRDKPVLTVTEWDHDSGGIINFVVVDNKVRFDIALSSAERRRLKISARLLEVARRVVEKPS